MNTIIETKEMILRLIEENKDKVSKLGVKRLGLFGSYVRGDQDENSDIDILVEFSLGKKNFDNFIFYQSVSKSRAVRFLRETPGRRLRQWRHNLLQFLKPRLS